MKLIVGLGNPGKEYEKTRHNIGFMAINSLMKKYNFSLTHNKFSGLYNIINIEGEKIVFLEPQKYMNLSGEVVIQFVNFYKININDILIICDDLDMELGKIRLRRKGSSGGHNGLKNIEEHLKTNEYKRLKIGISNNKQIDTKDYVLGKFNNENLETLNKSIDKVSSIIEDFIRISFEELMSKYN